MLRRTFGAPGGPFLTTTVRRYHDKRDGYLGVELQLGAEQLGVQAHQLPVAVMEVALNTDQGEVRPRKGGGASSEG